jgi:O-acetyl-ADP-ribose deacetylase (regulator of RNase III)
VVASNRIDIILADITKLEVDAIVNAANSSLLGGAGVDGAIHRAAGPGLLDECRQLGGCPTGEAKITAGHRLRAHHVIHAVGPVWNGGAYDEAALLAGCYVNSLRLATPHGIRRIAFPAISCGVYRYPLDQAVTIALRETLAFLARNALPEKVIFACFDKGVHAAYLAAMRDWKPING